MIITYTQEELDYELGRVLIGVSPKEVVLYLPRTLVEILGRRPFTTRYILGNDGRHQFTLQFRDEDNMAGNTRPSATLYHGTRTRLASPRTSVGGLGGDFGYFATGIADNAILQGNTLVVQCAPQGPRSTGGTLPDYCSADLPVKVELATPQQVAAPQPGQAVYTAKVTVVVRDKVKPDWVMLQDETIAYQAENQASAVIDLTGRVRQWLLDQHYQEPEFSILPGAVVEPVDYVY